MTDEQKALLGDHEAAKRLTEKGVLVQKLVPLGCSIDIPENGFSVRRPLPTSGSYIVSPSV